MDHFSDKGGCGTCALVRLCQTINASKCLKEELAWIIDKRFILVLVNT